ELCLHDVTAWGSGDRGTAVANRPPDAGWKLTFDLLRQVDDVARGLGARLVLVTIPAPPGGARPRTPAIGSGPAFGGPAADRLEGRAGPAQDPASPRPLAIASRRGRPGVSAHTDLS